MLFLLSALTKRFTCQNLEQLRATEKFLLNVETSVESLYDFTVIIGVKNKTKKTVTSWPMFSPEVLGFLPMAHRRQSTSWMVLTFSSSFFFSGSLVTTVTSRPLSVLHTDFTWEFFHRSMPEFCSSLVQFALMKLSKFRRTCKRKCEKDKQCHH